MKRFLPSFPKSLFAGILLAIAVMVVAAFMQARAVERKGDGIRAGMTVDEVLQHLDGWSMINTHPADSRAIPHGTGPEFNGYSGEIYVLTPVQPDGTETDLQKISREEFERRLNQLLRGGKPWTAYFSFQTFPTDTGILVRFDGNGRVGP